MGGRPPHGQGLGRVPGLGGAASNRAAPVAENILEVGVHLISNDKGGGRVIDNGGVNSAKAEHGRTIHCYAISSGPV